MKVSGSGPRASNRKSGQGSPLAVAPAEEGEGESGGGEEEEVEKE